MLLENQDGPGAALRNVRGPGRSAEEGRILGEASAIQRCGPRYGVVEAPIADQPWRQDRELSLVVGSDLRRGGRSCLSRAYRRRHVQDGTTH